MLAYEILNLTKQYPGQAARANDDVSLTIEAGEFFGLLGDNGAGKTTLVKQMTNLLKPTSGSIRLFGKALDAAPLYTAQQIGYMSQSLTALNSTTVGEALYFTAHLRGLSRLDARLERDRLLEVLALGDLRDKPFPRLSGGQKRLALLGACLAASPRVLILDEPTNELAPQNRVRVWELLRQINHERGTTIMLVTHNVLEAEKVIQRVGIMRQGKLVAVGRPGVLKAGLNDQLRLEIIFAPETPPTLPDEQPYRELAPGRWQILIERDAAALYLDWLHRTPSIEDFRLGTATLEDLYLSMVEER